MKILILLLWIPLQLLAQEDHSGHVHESMGSPATPVEDLQIRIDPLVVQNMGVRVRLATLGDLSQEIRTLGVIDIPENEISNVNLKFSGWIEKQYVAETGARVKRGDKLFEIYSPELVSAQEEYLLALSGPDQPDILSSAAERLRFFGLTQQDVHSLKKSKKARRTVTVRAPQSGYILARSVVEGSHAKRGINLYQIGNLDKIWVNAEVYDFDAPWIVRNAQASMELPFMKGKLFEGRVSFVHPMVDPKTRTLKVRLEFSNPGLNLKPGMFATVFIEGRTKSGVVMIPEEAIIQTGKRQIVFLANGSGEFSKREIVTGLAGSRGMIEVLEGLAGGDIIVTSGQFLLDSESQLKEAVAKMMRTNLKIDENSEVAISTEVVEYYWTCGMHPQIVQDGPGTCPICGMNLTKKRK